MSEDAKKTRQEYMRAYQQKNKKRLAEYQRKWRFENSGRAKGYTCGYWERKAQCG
ncbi:MAG: hypothetical protein WCG21_10780 [Eubacteriales bacterium]